jgi:hypothetical protein
MGHIIYHICQDTSVKIKMFSFNIQHQWPLTWNWKPSEIHQTTFNEDIKTNSVAFSPQASYTDWTTATCWRNLVPTFADRGVSRGQCSGSPTVINLSFLDQSRSFFPSSSSFTITRAKWTPFQTHCYSENLAAPGIESETSVSAARKSNH